MVNTSSLSLSRISGESNNSFSANDPVPPKKKRRKHRRSTSDPLKKKVRKYRKRCEQRSNQIKWVEQYMFIFTGVIGGFLAIFLIVALIADISCDVCLYIAITLGFLSVVAWSCLKLSEALAIRRYRKLRQLDKQRSAQKRSS